MGALVFDKRSATICSPRLAERFSTNVGGAGQRQFGHNGSCRATGTENNHALVPRIDTGVGAHAAEKPLPSVFSPMRPSPTVLTAPMMAASGAISSDIQ
jgi:hypothetical protein